ncbi:MAG: peptide deformylase [Pseudomonadota bacterium]
MEILTFPNKKLKEVATNYDLSSAAERKSALALAEKMKNTMYEANGLGLAATQVGVSKKLFIIDIEQKVERDDNDDVISRSPGELHVFINPEIIEKEGEVIFEEGCLSVPGVYEEIKRARKVTIEFFDADFEKKTMIAEDLMAVVIQHEYDHLIGKLFVDRLPIIKRTILKKRLSKGRIL